MPPLSTILNVAAPVVGGLLNNNAASNATNNLTTGVNNAINTVQAGGQQAGQSLTNAYNQSQGLLNPFIQAGQPALSTVAAGTAPGGDFVKPFDANTFDLYKDPGFQYRLKLGQDALKAEGNATGTRFSGATLKALTDFNQESASQEYSAARQRAIDDQTRAYSRTMDVTNLGYNATGKAVDAGTNYGKSLASVQQSTADQLASLQTDLASAKAAGDVAKASSITQAINGVMSGLDKASTATSLAKQAAGIFNPATSAGLNAAIGAGGPAAAAGAAATAIPGGVAASLPGDAAAAGGSGALFGLGAIPVAGIAAATALGIGMLWKHSQSHQTADQWSKGPDSTQNMFDKQMSGINENQQLDPDTKSKLQQAAVSDYLKAAIAFEQKHGTKGQAVIRQAMDTLRQWYPQYAGQSQAVA